MVHIAKETFHVKLINEPYTIPRSKLVQKINTQFASIALKRNIYSYMSTLLSK